MSHLLFFATMFEALGNVITCKITVRVGSDKQINPYMFYVEAETSAYDTQRCRHSIHTSTRRKKIRMKIHKHICLQICHFCWIEHLLWKNQNLPCKEVLLMLEKQSVRSVVPGNKIKWKKNTQSLWREVVKHGNTSVEYLAFNLKIKVPLLLDSFVCFNMELRCPNNSSPQMFIVF